MENNIFKDVIKVSKRNIIKIIFLQVIISFLSVYYLALVKDYIDECISGKNLTLILQAGIFIFCVGCGIIILRYYFGVKKDIFIKRTSAYIRNKIMHNVLLLKLRNFERFLTSELSMILNYDVKKLMNGIFNQLFSQSINVFILLIAMVYIFFIDINASLFLIVEFVGVGIILSYINRKISAMSEKSRNIAGKMNDYINDTIEGIYEIKLFNKGKEQYNEYLHLNKSYINNYRIISFFSSIPVEDVLMVIMEATVITVLGVKMIKTNQDIYGELLIFFIVIGYIVNPVGNYFRVIEKIQNSLKSLKKINKLMAINKDDITQGGVMKLDTIKNIEFNNVYFAYESDKFTLKDITMTINKGEKIAIIGVNGSGKTTLVSLFNRLYNPIEGTILINGKNISHYMVKELRKRIIIVFQENKLFIDNVIENIKLGDASIQKQKIVEIMDDIFGPDFSQMLDKEKTHETISKTQKHLISIIQALVRDADVYIFDEVTSDLDAHTESELKMIIEKYFKEKTCIFITHQIHSLPNVTKIIVLNNGEIEEMGSHKELLAKKGMYYTLYNIQYLETLFTKIFQMVNKLALKDGYTRYHYLKSALLARRVCEKLNLSNDLTDVIELAAYLSDIGKLHIPEEILKKRGALSPEEKKLVQQHVIFGNKITREMEETYAISHIIYHHHERWDGGGYPEGLKGEDIPFGSRIITIIDSYRAMMTGRPYRSKLGQKESIKRLKLGAGTHFDAHLVDIFLEVLNEEGEKELENKRIIDGYERWYDQVSKKT